jgi:hypothetical protein
MRAWMRSEYDGNMRSEYDGNMRSEYDGNMRREYDGEELPFSRRYIYPDNK